MTTTTRPTYRYRNHIVVGTIGELSNVVTAHRRAGTFVGLGQPRPLTGDRVEVGLRVLERLPSRAAARPATRVPAPVRPTVRAQQPGAQPATVQVPRVQRSRRVVLIAGGATVLLAGIGYLLVRLVELIAAHLPLILGSLAVLLILAAVTGGSRVCTGVHCGGCKRH
jgi:hypothetical protein